MKYARKTTYPKRKSYGYKKSTRYPVRGSRIPRPLVSSDSVVYTPCVSRQVIPILNREVPNSAQVSQFYSVSIAWNNYAGNVALTGNVGINGSGCQFVNMYPQFEEFTVTGVAIKFIPGSW